MGWGTGAGALGQLGRVDEAAELLLALAWDEAVEARVRYGAAKALGELGRADEASEAWLALAQDEAVEAWVRRWAAEALGRLGRATPEVLAGLRALAEELGTPKGVRRAVRMSLWLLAE